MTNAKSVPPQKLTQSDREFIKRIIYKNDDDIAVSIGRSFERLEDRIVAAESRIFARLTEVAGKIEACRLDMAVSLRDIREDLQESKKADTE